MEVSFAVLAGVCTASGLYLLMSRELLRVVIGFMIISQAANLLVFLSGGLQQGAAPLIPLGSKTFPDSPEPLSQALILTAIVIGFGVTAFLVVLAIRTYLSLDTDDPDAMRSAEP